jgi:serine/threonine protein kinase
VDIWNLGICILEFAEGKNPWEDLSPLKAMFKLKSAENCDISFKNANEYSNSCKDFL